MLLFFISLSDPTVLLCYWIIFQFFVSYTLPFYSKCIFFLMWPILKLNSKICKSKKHSLVELTLELITSNLVFLHLRFLMSSLSVCYIWTNKLTIKWHCLTAKTEKFFIIREKTLQGLAPVAELFFLSVCYIEKK